VRALCQEVVARVSVLVMPTTRDCDGQAGGGASGAKVCDCTHHASAFKERSGRDVSHTKTAEGGGGRGIAVDIPTGNSGQGTKVKRLQKGGVKREYQSKRFTQGRLPIC